MILGNLKKKKKFFDKNSIHPLRTGVGLKYTSVYQ